jgi:hypothetical protein
VEAGRFQDRGRELVSAFWLKLRLGRCASDRDLDLCFGDGYIGGERIDINDQRIAISNANELVVF